MIKSRFSKAILPLAFTTAISGGMLVKTSLKTTPQKNEIKTEQTTNTNPIENPAVLGTIFSLGLLATAGAATLGKAVDLRYKNSYEKIEEIYDIATITDDDYKEAFEDACNELNAQGKEYDKETLKKQYTPLSKEELIKNIDANKAHIRRVTENCNQDPVAARELSFLIDELKSAVKNNKIPDNDDIKYKMLYRFDKATLPAKQWDSIEKQYKTKHPNINFDEQIGIPGDNQLVRYTKIALEKFISDKQIVLYDAADLLEPLYKIRKNLKLQPEILNQYDKEECLKLTDKAISILEHGDELPDGLFQEILHIFIINQRTY